MAAEYQQVRNGYFFVDIYNLYKGKTIFGTIRDNAGTTRFYELLSYGVLQRIA